MVSAGLQMLGTALAIIGWIMTIVICALPMWKVTAFIGNNIVTAQITWEGIWMSCVVQSTGQMQCKVYDSMLALSSDLQAARALCVISILIGIFGILLAIAGGKCTNCVEDESSKAKVGIASGVAFIVSGILCLIPVCWTANTIIRDFYNPLILSAQKYEIGASLYIGWAFIGILTAFLGWLGVIVACCLPQWRVTAFIGANIVTAQIIWEGIWMTCAVQSTGQMQCKIYDSMLALTADLQAARAMIIISILAGIIGIMASIAGGKCTNCIENSRAKAMACIVAGVCFIIAGVLCLIPVSWTAQSIIAEFYNPLMTDAQRRELGTSLYIGWAAAGLMLMGGILLCLNCPPNEQRIYNPKYTSTRLTPISREYV
ncbi:claudin-4-like [Hemibagrus wyckioides]|uniref:claudin-4-like n=1 Tax=Hemibagrus wyckioides TaxID=337641 RepID=UPI00266D2B6F|nr:claudin-4-like [Hemibagrus wyckioides]